MNIILECEYGSQAYGLATKDSDSDLLAVNVESPKYVTGLQESKTKRGTTAGDGNRSQAGDTDRTIHPLRKWASLCAGGNPTILTTLFVPHYTVATDHSLNFILHRDAFISKKAGYAHLGYMNSQLKALQGERHKNVARPELEEKYGYDTKFAYNAVRLGVQGIQLMEHGMYTLPFEGEDRKLFMDIRNGELGKQEVVYLIEDYAKQLKKSIDNTKLPDNADYERINTLLHKVYQTEWDRYDYRNQ